MAYTNFPSKFYFELRYQGKPCVPFNDSLRFLINYGNIVPSSQYRTNGTVVVYELSWDSSLPNSTSFAVYGIKGCTVTSSRIDTTSSYDYSYDSTIPTYYLEVTPASAYTCHVYTGTSTANSVSNATVEIRYDGNGVTYTGASDYVITATTNTSGNATLRWFSSSPNVVAWKGTSAGTKTASTGTTNIQLTAKTSTGNTYYYKGYVKDDKGNPLAGAGVIFEDGGVVFTDSTGMFSQPSPQAIGIDPGPVSATIVTKDYIPYSGQVESWRDTSSSVNTYVLDSPDTIEPYVVPDDKILTLYDIWNLMSVQWHRLNQGLNGKTATLDLDKCGGVFSAVTNAYYNKDDDGNLPDFSTQPSGYCPTALYPPRFTYAVPAYIAQKLLGYTYNNSRKLLGITQDVFGFSYDYGRCNPYKTVEFPEIKFTYNLSYVKATFEAKKASSLGIVKTLSAMSWTESFHGGTLELAGGVSQIVSISQAANTIEPIPYIDSGTIPIRWKVSFNQAAEGVTFSTSSSAFDAGNDNFTLTNYTVSSSSPPLTTITIDGTINPEGFENKFTFKIPVN